jgi:hypothetical protein
VHLLADELRQSSFHPNGESAKLGLGKSPARGLSSEGNSCIIRPLEGREMSRCEVVEARNVEDADGYDCSRAAQQACSDCGSAICDVNAEACELCHLTFCPGCLFYHQQQHPKPASGDRHDEKHWKSA